jgi:hypothetical protein
MSSTLSPSGKPDASEYGQRRAYFARLGVAQAEFESLFGKPNAPLPRRQAADNFRGWSLATRPPLHRRRGDRP